MNSIPKYLIMFLLIAFVLFTVYFIIEGVLGGSPKQVIRGLGQFYVDNTYNLYDKTWWTGSPEAITAILWDYRGLDTVFETTVLYLAIIGCMILAYKPLDRLIKGYVSEAHGLTVIVKTAVKIVVVLIVLISMNLALRGYISPGGGFAGGSAYAVAPLLIIAGYSIHYLLSIGYRLEKAAVLRSIGLLVLVIVAVAPLAYTGYILQNQVKMYSSFPGYPVNIGPLYVGGTLLLMNLGEFLIVAMEFIIVFIIISLHKRGDSGSD